MLDLHPRAFAALFPALVAAALLTSCGGGGGGGDTAATGLSAGSNRTVLSSEPLVLTATASTDSGISDFAWRQTAGAAVSLSELPDGTVRFFAPERATTVELEVAGLGSNGGVIARDRVVIQVQSGRPRLSSELRSTIEVRGGGEGRATDSAVHVGSGRLFVIDGVAGDVLAYDVSSPGAPSFVGIVSMPQPTPGFSPGVPLAVAAGTSGAVGITWTGETPEFPGILQLVDPNTLQTLNQVSTSGSNPVDVEVMADGSLFAIACAGDPLEVGAGDAFGYVTMVLIPEGGPTEIEVHRDLIPVVLNPFDGDEAALALSGIRFFANNPTASVELTPRAVAISPDGGTVWASCPENDALVVIDVVSALITDLVPLEDRSFGSGGRSFETTGIRQRPESASTLLTTAAGQSISMGGVTGIIGVESNSNGDFAIRTVSAAGPATSPQDRDGNGTSDITLIDAGAAQATRTVTIPAFFSIGELTVTAQQPLVGPGNVSVTGAPSLYAAQAGLAQHDEEVLDLAGSAIPADSYGARFGGATLGPSDQPWLGEMRRNGLWHFNSTGQVLARYVPVGTPSALGTPTLPAVFAQRRLNLDLDPHQRHGGFGGVAYSPDRASILAVTRLPLDNPDTADDAASRGSRVARLVELDVSSGALLGEYAVVLESLGNALEGMAYTAGNGQLDSAIYLLESATDPNGFRAIFDLDLKDATNLRSLSSVDYAAVSAVLESTDPADLEGLSVPVVPARKTLRVDLRDIGLGGGNGQPSALAFNGAGLALVGFDDRFQLGNASIQSGTGVIVGFGGGPAQFGNALLLRNAGDFAGTDDLFLPRVVPIQGLHQPLALVGIEIDGESRVLSANGGLARVLPNAATGVPFDERARLGSLLLDTSVFPFAASLQHPLSAGNLLVSTVGSDLNGDLLVDQLLAFGSRSISLRSREGDEIWRSSRSLEERAHEEQPGRVAEAATFYGIRPSSLALGSIGGVQILAVGLEGAGSVMLYDMEEPGTPLLSGIGSLATRPVDVDIAPLDGTTLFVTDEARGVIEVRRLTRL